MSIIDFFITLYANIASPATASVSMVVDWERSFLSSIVLSHEERLFGTTPAGHGPWSQRKSHEKSTLERN